MKRLAIALAVLTVAGPVAVAAWVDTPTAAFVLAAWLVVLVCGGAPVVFGIVTRRRDQRKVELGEAEELRR
ncbi:MAG: hypothetical protein IT438_13275 [Phycisphaerales bacterium]|nr:hypothetical protein [Phycisphaerales bacterium]